MIFYENVRSTAGIFCAEHLLVIAVISLIFAITALPLAKKYLQILQQLSYQTDGYLSWLKKRPNDYNMRLLMLALLGVLAYALIVCAFVFAGKDFVSYIAFIPFFLFVLIYVLGDKKHADKCPLKITARVKRLSFALAILAFALCFLFSTAVDALCFSFKESAVLCALRLGLNLFLIALLPYLLLVANVFVKPVENHIGKKYVARCKEKLAKCENLVKIAVTGSYGKTTVKTILKDVLSVRFNVLATPESYNTPMGICKSVELLNPSHEIFIAEMGARHKGDVKDLCEIVKPDMGIITGICAQHLETFKTIDRIVETKFELADYLKNKPIVLSSDNELTASNVSKCADSKVVMAGIVGERADVYAENIKTGAFGSVFDLVTKNGRISVRTSLLGKHNVSDVCLASAIAISLGMSNEEIAEGIAKTTCAHNRLELVPNDNGLTIIDDSYNANEMGVKAAIEVMQSFEGRKIVVTPGLVEMGERQVKVNREFGKSLCFADFVILVGTRSAYNVREGLFEGGYDFDKVFCVKTLDEAKEKLKETVKAGDVVLFENDLPDRFL